MVEAGLRQDPESISKGFSLACIAPTQLPQTTPGYFVYALNFEQKSAGVFAVESSPLDVRPFWFHSEALAVRYAERVLQSTMIEVHRGDSEQDLAAALAWKALVTPNGPKELREPLIRDYFQAPALPPGQGIILWKPLLTARGIEIGVETGSGQLSTTDPPMVFFNASAASTITRHNHGASSNISPLSRLPDTLAHQLQPARSRGVESPAFGVGVYIRTPTPGPRIQASPPQAMGIPRPATGTDGQKFGATWYVSPHPRGAFAWRPVDDGRLVLLMTRSPPGPDAWHVQRWPDVPTALQNLGQVGVWAQRAPDFDPSPPSLGQIPPVRAFRGRSL